MRPSCAEQTDRLEPTVRLWSTSPFLFSGLLLAVWFGATMELGRSMMSAGAGAARATGSSTTDRKTALTAIAIHIEDAGKTGVFEVVLHADEVDGEEIYVPKFQEYLKSIGLNPPLKHRFYAGGLCFLELEGPRNKMRDMAAFSLVRAIRPMPPLRMLRPAIRTAGVPTDSVQLPNESPVDPKIRAVIFDGGLPDKHPLRKWATVIDAPGVGPQDETLLRHGVGVTSAFLFGHLQPNKPAPRPFSPVHHYRVVDTEPGQNPYELYEVLERIQNVLASAKYEFVNLSLGPELPVDDDDVHAWTAVFDDNLSHGECLAVVAAGNGGMGGQRSTTIGADKLFGTS